METRVCFRHKKNKLCLDLKYLKEHKGKTLKFTDNNAYVVDGEYAIDEIPLSDDWKVEIKEK